MKKTLTVEKTYGTGTREISRDDFISKWVAHASGLHWMIFGPGEFQALLDKVRSEAGRHFDDLLRKEELEGNYQWLKDNGILKPE